MTVAQTPPKNAQTVQPAVYRCAQAAPYIGVSRSQFYNLAKSGEFPILKLGERASGVLRSDLDAWLSKQRTAALA
ncbi:helix-turn-helix transcriptional regulator [Roseateles oligotrophus]|uniref:helix-turn-helix transcriptional regulator n=1 Tax=Roseateles oligotrophus TaxID=1769250 RepID=UPI0037CB90F7